MPPATLESTFIMEMLQHFYASNQTALIVSLLKLFTLFFDSLDPVPVSKKGKVAVDTSYQRHIPSYLATLTLVFPLITGGLHKVILELIRGLLAKMNANKLAALCLIEMDAKVSIFSAAGYDTTDLVGQYVGWDTHGIKYGCIYSMLISHSLTLIFPRCFFYSMTADTY